MREVKLTALVGAIGIYLGVLATPLLAGSIGLGVSGEAMFIETVGKETLKSSAATQSAKEDAAALVPSGYLQYTFGDDGFVIGYEYTPGKATLGEHERTKSELQSNVEVRKNVTNKAEAELTNLQSIYVETPGAFGGASGGLFLGAGLTYVNLKTLENLATGAAYKDQNVWGKKVSMGWRGSSDDGKGILTKVSAVYTDYDHITLRDQNNSLGQTIIDGDIETWGLKLSIGYNF